MKILITGGTGLIGKVLTHMLIESGHTVINLSRGSEKGKEGDAFRQVKWDGSTIPAEVGAVEVLINLAGAGIADKRWTDARKKILRDSRVDTTRACSEYINAQIVKPKVFICASGSNFYDSSSNKVVSEEAEPGGDFLSKLCAEWETEAYKAQIRTVTLRTSLVLSKKGGALPSIVRPYKFFVGGPIGSGKQGFPWIHMEDYCRIIFWVMENESISGPINMCSPKTPSQGEFSKDLAKVLKRPNFFRVPGFVLKLLFGELAILLLQGAYLDPKVLRENGFEWKFPEAKAALKNALDKE